jgi:hypothetical protein
MKKQGEMESCRRTRKAAQAAERKKMEKRHPLLQPITGISFIFFFNFHFTPKDEV